MDRRALVLALVLPFHHQLLLSPLDLLPSNLVILGSLGLGRL